MDGRNLSLIASDFIKKLQELRAQRNFSQSSQINDTSKKHQNYTFADVFLNLPMDDFEEENIATITLVLIFYGLIILVSFFGNCLVCKITFGKSRTKSTMNLFIGNISISDVLMTSINIPLQLTEKLVRNWPLGTPVCKGLHFIASLTVCVSTLTMSFIALDRFQFIVYPLKPRPTIRSIKHKILLIWIIAAFLSFPYAWLSEVDELMTYKPLIQCRINYPAPEIESRKILSLISILALFTIPLSITFITYSRICLIVWRRRSIGLTTRNQAKHQRTSKWRTIKMLILVLFCFVICWSPLMTYHTYQDIKGETNSVDKHNITVWWICHWLAMSSSCFNPFIYCWLNEKFQKAAKEQLMCFGGINKKRSQKRGAALSPQSRDEDLPGTSGENSNNKSQVKRANFAAFGIKENKLNDVQLGKTVAKALSHSVSVYIPKQQTVKSEDNFDGIANLKRSKSEAFV